VLLPIAELVALRLERAPLAARGLDGLRLAAVEQQAAELKVADLLRRHPLAEEEVGGAVRIFGSFRQPDRLVRSVAVLRRAVRQEAPLVAAPEDVGESLAALRVGKADQRPLSPLQRLAEQLRQGRLEWRPRQVIESHLGHRAVPAQAWAGTVSGQEQERCPRSYFS